jgi:NAD(P)H-flavin reductase
VELFRHDIARLGEEPQSARDEQRRATFARLDEELLAVVVRVERLTPTIVEVVVRAPAAARKFEPGQFYRLQNYEVSAPLVDGSRLAMEGIALTGAWVDKEQGLLSLIALEMGVSSRLLAGLRPGEEVVVMGPTGTPTEIPDQETVLLAGGGLGNAVLFSIAKALKARGDRVIYFAGYKKGEDLFKQDDIEVATDQVVWCTDSGVAIEPRRPGDRHFRGNIVQAMRAYAEGQLGGEIARLSEVRRIIAIGSDRMMNAVREARHGVLLPHLDPKHVAIASINSPMQCMMKEVCAQCLQRHVDPETGKETVVFTCYNQDQPIDRVDFKNLSARLRLNSAQEKLTNAWFDRLLDRQPELRRI